MIIELFDGHRSERITVDQATSSVGHNHDFPTFQIVKIDCDRRKTLIWTVDNDNQMAAEPIFVANPEGKSEDDGNL